MSETRLPLAALLALACLLAGCASARFGDLGPGPVQAAPPHGVTGDNNLYFAGRGRTFTIGFSRNF